MDVDGIPLKCLRTHMMVHGLEHLDYLSIQLGMSSSQLTNIFWRC